MEKELGLTAVSKMLHTTSMQVNEWLEPVCVKDLWTDKTDDRGV